MTIPVSNTGKRGATEIVQVYVHKVNDADGPLKTLRGFRRVYVAPGSSEPAVIDLPYSSFEFFNRNSGKTEVTPGEYEVLYGKNSDSKDLKTAKIIID
ncbi:MAG: fibronectin type III-like domain-contianing protein [Ignavibacteriaceae bacterium]